MEMKVKTNLKDATAFHFIDGVIGQLSDGWGENSNRWVPYWQNMKVVAKNGEAVIVIDYKCPLYGKSDKEILEFFAKNIKKTAKMAEIEWNRKSQETVEGYFCRAWNVRDCYFVYDWLMGRDVNKYYDEKVVERFVK